MRWLTVPNFMFSRDFTKAIEQLGSDKLDVRIGAIFALERVARDSPKHHAAVMEVLAAFIREHSHPQWPPPRQSQAKRVLSFIATSASPTGPYGDGARHWRWVISGPFFEEGENLWAIPALLDSPQCGRARGG